MTQRDFWDRAWKAADQERLAALAEQQDLSEDPLIRFLKALGAEAVCDAGCGSGLYALKLARHGFAVSGFDLSADAAAMTGKLLASKGFLMRDFRAADVLATGYQSGQFDAVVARDVIDHMPIRDARSALAELLRIVRPGGSVLLTLDGTDGEYEARPHEVDRSGDYIYLAGKWKGMVFHPYSPAEIERLTQGQTIRLLDASENRFTVALEKR